MFDQLVVGAAPGDAITDSAFLLHDRLRLLGPARIYAEHREPGLRRGVLPLSEMSSRPNAARPLVFHASMGSWPVLRAVERETDIVLVYHNFSPPEPFAAFAPAVASDLVRARWELERIRPRVRLAIAVSEFNAGELRDLGFTDVVVIPPTPDVFRLSNRTPDVAMLQRISSWGDGPLVLSVAQLLPHKRVDRTLAAFAVLQQEFRPDARLALVGTDRFSTYSASLRSLAESLGIREPQFLGKVTDEELAALYLRADVLLTLSDHEGFCVPVVEAMTLGVPVIASDRAALPDTVDDAGIIVDPEDPVTTAALLDRVVGDEELRHILIGRGVSRARELDADATLPRLVEAVCSTVPDLAAQVRAQILARIGATP